MNKRTVTNEKKVSASSAGEVSFGGELSVHRLDFGAMRITGEGIWGPPRDSAGALAVLRRAVELGVNFIDTADSYGSARQRRADCQSAGAVLRGPGDRDQRWLESSRAGSMDP